MSYAITTTVAKPFDEALQATRDALAEQGFGVLTEIDVKATMKAKLDVDVPAHTILGACRPPLAHEALQREPSLGLLLPCNVVVRDDQGTIVVEAIDPSMMVEMTGNAGLQGVATEATKRLSAAIAAVAAGATSAA